MPTVPTRLSPHFHLAEFATNSGILPPPDCVEALRRLCVVYLEPVRKRYGVCRVTSGYRTEAHNRAVGGAKNSRHVYDRHPTSPAADVRFASGTPVEWARALDKLGVGGLGVYRSHVHVDARASRARW